MIASFVWIAAFLAAGMLWTGEVTAAGPGTDGAEKSAAERRLELRDGDRIILLGGTFIERAQRYGCIETALTSRHPDRNLTFRNLGWSGDTVFAESRGIFDAPAVGYRRMIEQIRTLEPVVVVVAYGVNESFAGEPGLERFVAQLHVLLDDLEKTGARIALMLPHRFENLGPPLPDPAQANANLQLYAEALKQAAGQRGYPLIDLFSTLVPAQTETPAAPWTDNGMHLTERGYRKAAAIFEQQVGGADPTDWNVSLDAGGNVLAVGGGKLGVLETQAAGLRFDFTDSHLPALTWPEATRTLQVKGLPEGRYTLSIDGRAIVTRSAADWAEGVLFDAGPDFEQAQALRAAIIEKNRLYFHHWRPQNVTYLFGFRKHEQGQNAKEVEEFRALVEEQEASIAKLRQPVRRRYVVEGVMSAGK